MPRRVRNLAGWLPSVWVLLFWAFPSPGQTVFLNVTNFGARGDVAAITANTISNSATIVCPANHFSIAEAGKVVELFGAGPATSPTNHQDLLATIAQVVNDTTLKLDRTCGNTTTGASGIYGANDAAAFQACVDACPPGSTVVNIPAGQYLLLSPQALDPNYVMPNMFDTHPAVIIQKGGITFRGAGTEASILLGCGAWQRKGAFAFRGYMFACQGPVTNDAPLVFDQLTLDGGARPGRSSEAYFPASPVNGSGWDPTHDAVIDTGAPPYHRSKTFENCVFRNWRGEILKSVVSIWDGYVEVTNCVFLDGNATAFNFTFSHTIEHCFMSNLVQAVEFYQGYCSNACYFKNNTVTDMEQALYAVTGALTNHYNRPYSIVSNTFYLHGGQNGIQTTPAQNLSIIGNRFIGDGLAVTLGSSGYQGSDINSNIVIAGNEFNGAADAVMIEGSGQNAVWNVTVTNNRATPPAIRGNSGFASGYGWGTNLIFQNNTAPGLAYGLDSRLMAGQWFADDGSNQFPPQNDYGAAGTNTISYVHGRRHSLNVASPQAVFVLDDSHPAAIPPGAEMEITPAGNLPALIYLSQTMSGAPVTVKAGQKILFYWDGGAWTTNGSNPRF